MTVIIELANGQTETFQAEKYVISKTKDFHPLICKVEIFDNGKRIAKKKRPFSLWYKLVTFKSYKVQAELQKLETQNNECV